MKTIPFHAERGCLSYLILDERTKTAALIDPSDEIADARYLDALKEHGAKLAYLIETHTHADHISSAPRLRQVTGARLVRHEAAPSPLKDLAVKGGETLPLGSSVLEVIATPGHTNESISIKANDAVFTGDALLIGGTGRTDFQLGDSEALYRSLHETLGALPDESVVYPGHDYKGRTSSTMGAERSANPRLALSHDAFVTAMDAHHPPTPEQFEASLTANSR